MTKELTALEDADDAAAMPPPAPVASADYSIGEFGVTPPAPPTHAALHGDVKNALESLQALVRVEESMPRVSAGGLASQFLRGDDLESVTRATTRDLPAGWRAMPSASRPGQMSYLHDPTGFKQSKFPTGAPADAAVAKYRAALKAKSKKRKATAPLLKNAPTANWQSYIKKQGAKR